MQVKNIAEGEHSAKLSTLIKLSLVIKIFVLTFSAALKTGFTVLAYFVCVYVPACMSVSVVKLSRYVFLSGSLLVAYAILR